MNKAGCAVGNHDFDYGAARLMELAEGDMLLDSIMLDNQVLITYITENLGGTVGDEYADPYGQGRIRILK